MKRVLIVCEGPGDRTLFREYLSYWRPHLRKLRRTDLGEPGQDTYESEPVRTQPVQSDVAGRARAEAQKHQVVVVAAQGKSDLARRLLEKISPTVGDPFLTSVVSFDPDDATDQAHEFSFFEKDFAALVKKAQGTGPLVATSPGKYHFDLPGHQIALVALPWRTPANPPFDGLPDERNLERVILEALTTTHAQNARHNWVADSVAALEKLGANHGWKRALLLWNAALHPKIAEPPSFIAKLLTDSETRANCMKAIESTGLRAVLDELLPE